MITILTSIIGLVAKGRAAKAIAGGLGTLGMAAFAPAIKSFNEGLGAGLGTSTYDLGLTLGAAIGSFLVGYVITWLAPANKDA